MAGTRANVRTRPLRRPGQMATRGLYVFKHGSELGNARAHELFERIAARPLSDIPRSFADFKVTVGLAASLPAGVTLIRQVD